jgi:HAE1 family hydrophobic/amphiphilic exporter-1
LFEGAVLTVLVVFLFLNSWRSTVITGLALPVSVLASFIAVWAFGFTLNTMSLLGLSLAIGILIDDAIVVRENIVRHIEMGEDHYAASQTGTDEIGLAVAATTFSIVSVFVPVAFMYGLAGQWFKPFALTIACAVLVSLFVSFSLDPMLSAYWADPQTEQRERRNAVARAIDGFNRWFNRQADRYRGLIAWALDHRLATVVIALATFFAAISIPAKGVLGAVVILLAMLAIVWVLGRSAGWSVRALGTVAVVLVAVGVMRRVPKLGGVGFGFVPVSDRSELNVAIETPPGSSIDYTRLKAEELARLVRAHREVAYTYTTIGSATGSGVVDEGNIYVRLVPKKERGVSQDVFGRIVRQEIRRVAGVTAYTYSGGFAGNQKQIQLQVQGPDANVLSVLADRIAAVVRQVPGATDVGLSTKGQKPELDVEVNRGLAGTLGVSVAQVAQALRPAFAGIDAGDWVDPSGQTRYVYVRLAPRARQNAADLAQLPIILPGTPGLAATAAAAGGGGAAGGSSGAANGGGIPVIPLGQVATIRQSVGPAQIDHLNRQRVITVGANVEGSSLGTVSQVVTARLTSVQRPVGYRISQGGEVESQRDVFSRIFLALGIAVLLMYLILVVQFGSFLNPLAILVSLPLSLIGVVLALLVTGDTLNIMSLIGVVLLMGIVAKNAILLIDFAEWGRERGMRRRDAIIEAGRIRLRPIMMTTLALIAGMTPVALGLGEGADFRAPLGRAVIGGVITSTLLTLLVIPTIYEILDEWREWMVARFRGPRVVAEGQRVAIEHGVGEGVRTSSATVQ